jgi:ABC-2 type transport system permease protein
MSSVLRHAALWFALLRTSVIAELEYRANIVGKVGADFLWYAAQVSLFEVLFKHSNLIGDWSLADVRVFMGVLFFFDALYMVLFHDNLDNFSTKVVKGELDLILAKPVSAQFMMSVQKVSVPYLINAIIVLMYLAWAVETRGQSVSIVQGGKFVLAGTCGLVIMYSIRFFFASLAVIFNRADGIAQFWYQIYRLATRPDAVYPSWLRWVVVSILPVGFVASVPTRLLIGRGSDWLMIAAIGLAAFSLMLSRLWWGWALKRYSSASS